MKKAYNTRTIAKTMTWQTCYQYCKMMNHSITNSSDKYSVVIIIIFDIRRKHMVGHPAGGQLFSTKYKEGFKPGFATGP